MNDTDHPITTIDSSYTREDIAEELGAMFEKIDNRHLMDKDEIRDMLINAWRSGFRTGYYFGQVTGTPSPEVWLNEN